MASYLMRIKSNHIRGYIKWLYKANKVCFFITQINCIKKTALNNKFITL